MAARFTGFRESQIQRSALPVPHALPFLLIGSHLVAPWPTARVLSPKQAVELRQVLAVLQTRAGPLPPFAWVTITGEVTPMPAPEASWIARRMHDGHTVAVGPPVRQRGGRRISPAASRVFRELAAGRIAAGAVVQP
jgi:hypothetical protein